MEVQKERTTGEERNLKKEGPRHRILGLISEELAAFMACLTMFPVFADHLATWGKALWWCSPTPYTSATHKMKLVSVHTALGD